MWRAQVPRALIGRPPASGSGATSSGAPAKVMQLPVQDVADSKEMILRAVCDERISVREPPAVPRWTALEAREPWRR